MIQTPEQIQSELSEAKVRIEKGELIVAEAKVKYDNLEEQKKNILATYIINSEESSAAMKKVDAEASVEWITFIEGLNQARSDYILANSKLKGLYASVDINRTLLSYNKHIVL